MSTWQIVMSLRVLLPKSAKLYSSKLFSLSCVLIRLMYILDRFAKILCHVLTAEIGLINSIKLSPIRSKIICGSPPCDMDEEIAG